MDHEPHPPSHMHCRTRGAFAAALVLAALGLWLLFLWKSFLFAIFHPISLLAFDLDVAEPAIGWRAMAWIYVFGLSGFGAGGYFFVFLVQRLRSRRARARRT